MGQLDTSTARLSGLLTDDGRAPRLSVLLIDNDRTRAEVLLRQLGPMARFRVAATIGEAASADAQEPADLILASDDLPQTSLRAFTTLWKRASVHPATPVVGVGTGTSLIDEAFAHRCGVVAWLPRDASADLLRARLAMMLSLMQRPSPNTGLPTSAFVPASAPASASAAPTLARRASVALAATSAVAAPVTSAHAASTASEPPDPMPSDALVAQLQHEVGRARRVQQPMALLWVRIDHLGRHAALHGGDSARACSETLGVHLRQIARRASDVHMRHGEDGHVLILTETTEEGVRHLARRIVAEVAGGLIPRRPPTSRPLTVSVGVGFWQPAGLADDRGMALLTTAIVALRMAQRQGRNCSRLLGVPGRADAALAEPAAQTLPMPERLPYAGLIWNGPDLSETGSPRETPHG